MHIYADDSKSKAYIIAAENLLRQGHLKRGIKKQVEYCHVDKSQEPIVWAADAIAWSYSRGGDFKRRAQLLVEKEISVGL